jgi:hypothetical protein
LIRNIHLYTYNLVWLKTSSSHLALHKKIRQFGQNQHVFVTQPPPILVNPWPVVNQQPHSVSLAGAHLGSARLARANQYLESPQGTALIAKSPIIACRLSPTLGVANKSCRADGGTVTRAPCCRYLKTCRCKSHPESVLSDKRHHVSSAVVESKK